MNSLLSNLRNFLNRQKRSWKRAEAVFNKAYFKNSWGSKESASGTGSEMIQTRVLIEKLPGILTDLKVGSMLDLPCGDLNWMRHVDLGDIRYIGADIVTPIIEKNIKEFAGSGREFFRLNLITDDLPAADLVFCRGLPRSSFQRGHLIGPFKHLPEWSPLPRGDNIYSTCRKSGHPHRGLASDQPRKRAVFPPASGYPSE
jgi:hypothetical protein